MKNVFLKIGEVLCVVLLAVFMLSVLAQEKPSEQPFEKVSQAVLSLCDTDGLLKGDKLRLKKQFSLDANTFRDFAYYSSDSVMDVREVLVIAFEDSASQAQTVELIKNYVTEKQQIFEGYAPEESGLLASYVLIAEKGYLLFYVGDEPERVSAAFKESL